MACSATLSCPYIIIQALQVILINVLQLQNLTKYNHIVVFWVIILCYSLVDGHHRFGPMYLVLPPSLGLRALLP